MNATMSRRDALKFGGAAAMLATARLALGQDLTPSDEGRLAGAYEAGQYVLPPLPYDAEALEPLLDAQTLRIHHDKHHAGYVRGLNTTLAKLSQAQQTQDFSAIKSLSKALAFNGSGHILHCLLWRSMVPDGNVPSAEFGEALTGNFGSFDACRAQFAAAAKTVEGSGWAILALEPVAGKLLILQAEKHQNLALWGVVPLLVCDVWEHAYYLQYQNRRDDWVDSFMKMADWSFASKQYTTARSK